MAGKRVSDFSRKEIYDFIMTYCFSPLFSTLEELAASYNISKQTAKKLIYRSIQDCIVENDVVDILCDKAYHSAFLHACQDGISKAPSSTYNKYETLKKNRKLFCLSDEECTGVAISYLVSPLNKADFCKQYPMTKALLDRTLKKVIIEGLISDNIVEDLHQKALSFSSNPASVDTLFEKLLKARAEYQKQHI